MASQAPPLIRQLNERIANQIAAGEVVERPAAVVKELVENAIDAGASQISLRIEDGGRQFIEVVDNGHGMRREDLPLAVARHATSKIASAEDLFRIASLGFRGEALPSIASVSEFVLASCPPAGQGAQLAIQGGIPSGPVQILAMAPGTRVTVRNLFWNVPARLKFLKSARAESQAIQDILTRLAIGHPQLAVSLQVDGRNQIDLPAQQDVRERLRMLFNASLADSLLPVSGLAESTQIQGYVAPPEHARPTSKRQFVYLNGRPLADRMIVAAIREGFRSFLEPRLHGVVALFIDTDPSLVDVNVHPTKAEVRFRRQSEVFTLIRESIQSALTITDQGTPLLLSQPSAAPANELRRRVLRPSPLPPKPAPVYQERFLPSQPDSLAAALHRDATAPSSAQQDATVPSSPAHPAIPESGRRVAESAPALPAGLRQLTQLNNMYILIETEEGIRIIDQHALHEKALYLCLQRQAGLTEQLLGGRQELFIPQHIEVDPGDMEGIEAQLPELAEAGIEAEVFGPSQILLRAVPAALRHLAWDRFFTALAAQGSGRDAIDRLREGLLQRRACRDAIKAGQVLSQAEMLELVSLLYNMEGLGHCPHGRPSTLDLSWSNLAQRFQR